VRVADVLSRVAPDLSDADPLFVSNVQADLVDVIKTQAMPVVAAACRCIGALSSHVINVMFRFICIDDRLTLRFFVFFSGHV
jgi:hypothetical protein